MTVVANTENERNTTTIDGILNANGWQANGWDNLSFTKSSVAGKASSGSWDISVLDGTDYLGAYEDVHTANLFKTRTSVTLEVAITIDEHGVDGQTTPDEVDDRLQKGYLVRLETKPDSGLYTIKGNYYVNKSDDLVKKVTNGDYTNLPGLYASTYDSDDNEYVYQYRIDGDKIYGDWVKEGSALFATSTTNDKDTNGDGKVSCDEYYGTTGLEWSDKLNACVVSSTGDAVVTIPNTATK